MNNTQKVAAGLTAALMLCCGGAIVANWPDDTKPAGPSGVDTTVEPALDLPDSADPTDSAPTVGLTFIPAPTRNSKPKPKPRPHRTTEEPYEPDVYYANCAEVRAAGAAPIHLGQPGYSTDLDRDGDGTACDV